VRAKIIVFEHSLARRASPIQALVGTAGELFDRIGGHVDPSGRAHATGDAVADDLGHAADARCDHRQAARHRLEYRERRTLRLRRADEHVEAPVRRGHVVNHPDELDAIGEGRPNDSGFDFAAQRPVPDDPESQRRSRV